jgi:signal transduction histidine kinase
VSRPIGPVLRNLVENAVEHNDGDPHVTVTTSLADGALVLAVADDGPGLPEGERAVLRSRKETPLRHSSGLGLWLVSWGVETMGGSVSVDCPADGGTVVRLEIPLAGTPRAAGDPPRSSGRRDAR